jgi:hypothetical protein
MWGRRATGKCPPSTEGGRLLQYGQDWSFDWASAVAENHLRGHQIGESRPDRLKAGNRIIVSARETVGAAEIGERRAVWVASRMVKVAMVSPSLGQR